MSIFGYAQEPSYSNLVGKKVRINRGGPDSVEGTLYAVESNYLVVLAKDGIVYIKTVHVKSITVNLGSGGKSMGGSTSGRSQGLTRPIIIEYNFYGVLAKLKHQQVQINRGGPEKIEGLLVDVTSDTVLIIVKKELVRVLLSHIKSLTIPWKNSGKKDDSNKKQNNNASQSSGKNKKSSGNAAAGNAATGNAATGGNRNRVGSTGNAATGGNRNRVGSTGNAATGGNRNRVGSTGNAAAGAGRRSGGTSANNVKRNKCSGTMSARKSNKSSNWDPFPKQ